MDSDNKETVDNDDDDWRIISERSRVLIIHN